MAWQRLLSTGSGSGGVVTWSASLSVLVLVSFQSGPREEAGLPRRPPAELELMSKGGPFMGTVSQT